MSFNQFQTLQKNKAIFPENHGAFIIEQMSKLKALQGFCRVTRRI